MNRLILVSSDCHGGMPWEGYRSYLPDKYHDAFDEWLQTKYAAEAESKTWRNAFFSEEYQSNFNAAAERRGRPSNLGWEVPVATDRDRMEQLEADGIVAEVVFPDGNRDEPPWRGFTDVFKYSPELRAEGARAWNRWMVDLSSERPGQHLGGLSVDLGDVEAAVTEIRWAKEAGLLGILPATPPEWFGLPGFGHPRYEPIWATAVELDMPINFHLATGGADVCAHMICSGVFERHPGLRVAWTEQGVRWAATLLAELEALFDEPAFRHGRAGLSMRPSEYFARNCWLGHSGAEAKHDWELRHVLGVDKLMWGNDFPHPEGWWPDTEANLRSCFAGFDPHELRLVLGENAARFYGLDLDDLSKVAAEVGPELEKLV